MTANMGCASWPWTAAGFHQLSWLGARHPGRGYGEKHEAKKVDTPFPK